MLRAPQVMHSPHIAFALSCLIATSCGERAWPTDGAPADGGADNGATVDTTPAPDSGWVDTPCGRARAGSLNGEVCVPAGPFLRGDLPEEAVQKGSTPQRVITLSSFFIDRHEVTTARYARCVAAGACQALPRNSSKPGMPAHWMRWVDAQAFCAWDGRRLPTEAEWEKAARGGCELDGKAGCGKDDARPYPWGWDKPTCELRQCPTSECDCGEHPKAVDANPLDISPYGAIGMAGNIEEWVVDYYDPTYWATSPSVDPPGPSTPQSQRVLRGHWAHPLTSRHFVQASPVEYWNGGVRCARDASQ